MEPTRMRRAALEALEDIKGRDIQAYKVGHISSMFEYVIIATGESNRQVRALAKNVQEKLKAKGATVFGVEGEDSGEWCLVDLGSVVVHVMQPATRQYYNLEELWNRPKRRSKAEIEATAQPG